MLYINRQGRFFGFKIYLEYKLYCFLVFRKMWMFWGTFNLNSNVNSNSITKRDNSCSSKLNATFKIIKYNHQLQFFTCVHKLCIIEPSLSSHSVQLGLHVVLPEELCYDTFKAYV